LLANFANEWDAVLDAATGKRVSALETSRSSLYLTMGDQALSSSNGLLKSWDLLTGRLLDLTELVAPMPRSAAGRGAPSQDMEGAPRSQRAAVVSQAGSLRAMLDRPDSIDVRKPPDGSLIRSIQDQGIAASSRGSAAFSTDDTRLVAAGSDGKARIGELSIG